MEGGKEGRRRQGFRQAGPGRATNRSKGCLRVAGTGTCVASSHSTDQLSRAGKASDCAVPRSPTALGKYSKVGKSVTLKRVQRGLLVTSAQLTAPTCGRGHIRQVCMWVCAPGSGTAHQQGPVPGGDVGGNLQHGLAVLDAAAAPAEVKLHQPWLLCCAHGEVEVVVREVGHQRSDLIVEPCRGHLRLGFRCSPTPAVQLQP